MKAMPSASENALESSQEQEGFDEWERAREEDVISSDVASDPAVSAPQETAPHAFESPDALAAEGAAILEEPSEEVTLRSRVEKIGPVTVDISHDALAQEKLSILGADTIESCFEIANILHYHRMVKEAAYFYRRAYDLHDKVPTHFPTAPTLLQVSLLCRLKAGDELPQDELRELEHLCIPFADYIKGIEISWRQSDHPKALRMIGTAYEEFHTGEEADSLTLEVARHIYGEEPVPQRELPARRIPKSIYMYWDQNPPPEIQTNFDRHLKIDGFKVQIFDKHSAAQWLYENYGVEARSMFLEARHPAEAADFLRVHVINLLGGWWLDADLRIRDESVLERMAAETAGTVLFLTFNNVVHNDFFGSVANSEILTDCLLSLYRNGYLHRGLYIAYKTGPGIFNRALNRVQHRYVSGIDVPTSIKVLDHHAFSQWIEEFDAPYKRNMPTWHAA